MEYCGHRKRIVSVPYRGATFLNGTGSSPSSPLYLVSVPYRGATFLNHSSSSSLISLSVSVPYRGATFLNGKGEKFYEYDESFRPLSGSYISQSRQNHSTDAHITVSVPYRGATFLNTIPATPIPVWDELGDCGGKVILLKCSRFGK